MVRLLELYSGIGGMKLGCQEADVSITKSYAFDLNPVANAVYEHNFGEKVRQVNLESLSAADFDLLDASLWTMSPPCQPYTRQGNVKDMEDPRAKSLLHLITILPQLHNPPQHILLENVKNFEVSESCKLLLECLAACGYSVQQFLLSPFQFGFPNERCRYFLLAKRQPLHFSVSLPSDIVHGFIPHNDHFLFATSQEPHSLTSQLLSVPPRIENYPPAKEIHQYIEPLDVTTAAPFMLSDKMLETSSTLSIDIVQSTSRRSTCFTKAYGRYNRGTGSILEFLAPDETEPTTESPEMSVYRGRLRYFTPREVANLMGFPQSFSFPPSLGARKCYALLGNSLNVGVVAHLLRYLFEGDT
eukprot:GILJ01008241.1.p1 GENE.GILJ01008241.1~~GILJ01008241.1.p1  ORF type:complete len:358 (-),score=42.47 GILJ01008241.1:115-1188(-)